MKLLSGFANERSQLGTAAFQVLGHTVVIRDAGLLGEPFEAVGAQRHRGLHRDVVVVGRKMFLETEQVGRIAAVTVDENHQRLVRLVDIGLRQIIEWQIGVQGVLRLCHSDEGKQQDSEEFQHVHDLCLTPPKGSVVSGRGGRN